MIVGRDSSVRTSTRYGQNGTGIESRWGRDFPHRPDRPSGPPSLLYNEYRVFPGGKAAGAWRWPPTPSSVEVKERVELYIYSTSGSSWPVMGWILSLLWRGSQPSRPVRLTPTVHIGMDAVEVMFFAHAGNWTEIPTYSIPKRSHCTDCRLPAHNTVLQ